VLMIKCCCGPFPSRGSAWADVLIEHWVIDCLSRETKAVPS
jgi:hypothetical protein